MAQEAKSDDRIEYEVEPSSGMWLLDGLPVVFAMSLSSKFIEMEGKLPFDFSHDGIRDCQLICSISSTKIFCLP